MAISLSFHFELPYLSPVRSNISTSPFIGEYHGDTFTAFSRSDSFVWLIDTLGKINDIDAGWKATPDGSPALLVKTPLNLVQHRNDVDHIFLWDTAFNMIVGTRAEIWVEQLLWQEQGPINMRLLFLLWCQKGWQLIGWSFTYPLQDCKLKKGSRKYSYKTVGEIYC